MEDKPQKTDMSNVCQQIEISDDDIVAAMKQISGYLDITPGDFKEVYIVAYRQAMERLAKHVTAQDVMTRDVATVRPHTPLVEVIELLARREISGLPVVDPYSQVMGIISERNILRLLANGERCSFMDVIAHCLKQKGCAAVPLHKKVAADVMTRPAITVTAEWTAPDVSNLFFEKKINRVPVVDEKGFLIGIITRQDLVNLHKPEDSRSGVAGGSQ